MLPVIALVGRPNVGKSTLFNYLTRSREALVADIPGLTRDRQYGRIQHGMRPCLVVDTGGIADDAEGIESISRKQVQVALNEADVVIFMVDAREGISASDKVIADSLRKLNKPLLLVTNKVDGIDASTATAEFHSLALGEPLLLAASHGRGVPALLEKINQLLPSASELIDDQGERKGIGIAVIGRPNVGKSTLVNRILGEERVIVFDQPGTTRDSVYIPFERDGKQFTLIDTAGMRRRSRIAETIEKFSVIKALQAIDKAHVVIYLIDASEGVTDQDAHLLGLVLEAGRTLIIGLNKWDGLTTEQKEKVKRQIELKLAFVDFAEKHPISALHGSGVGKLFDVVHSLFESAMVNLSTSTLNRILKEATDAHQPPMVNNRRIKLKYAHQGGRNPPVIIVHGVQTDALPLSYHRYLTNYFRQRLQLAGTPLRLEFKTTANPFQGKKNTLTERQVQKRQRLFKHVKKKNG